MAFAGWFVQRLPTGFIPGLDRAILIISLQLPPGASLARTDAVVQRATDLVLDHARRQVFQRLHRPQRRHLHGRHQRRPAVPRARRLRGAAPQGPDHRQDRRRRCAASWRRSRRRSRFVFIPPPVRGMGAAAGFSMRLQDTLGMHAVRVRAHHAGVRRRGQPHARHRQRVHHLPVRRRRRSSSTSTATRRRC